MRFMMLMIPGVYQGKKGRSADEDFTPAPEEVEKMMKYNEELARAGVLISLDGLHPPVSGARVSFSGGKPKVKNVTSSETGDVLGGYWIIRAASVDEAVEWAKRVPAQDDDIIEVRRIFETEDFPEDVRKAADSPTVRAAVERYEQYECC